MRKLIGVIMDLEWISDFLELASTKNFTIAANNRNRSQPAFSRRISGLEQWVGVSLIDRSIHPFALTKEGEYFRESSGEIVAAIYRTLDECRQSQRKRDNFVKFTALHTLAINYFAQWMSEIHRDFSLIPTTMDANNIHDCVELLRSKQCEFMLSYSTPMIPSLLDPSDFLSVKLTTDKLILVSATKNNKPLHSLDENKVVNYLAYSSNCLMGKMTEKIISTYCNDHSFNCVYENTVTESIKAMVLQGIGIGWVPQICIQAELDRGDVIDIGGDALSIVLDIMLYRPAKRISNEGESLWAFLNK